MPLFDWNISEKDSNRMEESLERIDQMIAEAKGSYTTIPEHQQIARKKIMEEINEQTRNMPAEYEEFVWGYLKSEGLDKDPKTVEEARKDIAEYTEMIKECFPRLFEGK